MCFGEMYFDTIISRSLTHQNLQLYLKNIALKVWSFPDKIRDLFIYYYAVFATWPIEELLKARSNLLG